MKLSIFLLLAFLSVSNLASPKRFYITVGTDAVESLGKMKKAASQVISQNKDITLLEVNEDSIEHISHLMHEKFHRCGGFMFHEDLGEAQSELESTNREFASNSLFVNYDITQEALVESLMEKVEEGNIRSTILKLSSFHNRYYKAQTGVDSQDWIYNSWKETTSARNDISVEKWQHPSWPQPSVVLTIQGKSDDVIVIGGHADSIAGWWSREKAHAPGADDNASGIATLTETMRVIVESGYQPEKTIKFMAYAAEEVGLRGSKEIARAFRSEGKNVVGVLQLDMTNFKGSDLDIVMMTDYTNDAQNKFIGTLIDRYLPSVSWGYDKCGYGCSDHAAWHGEGFPASIPFEARMKEMNGHIHTDRDTISKSGDNAEHAYKFSKLAVAYALELDK